MAGKSGDDYEAYGGVKRLRTNIEPLEKNLPGATTNCSRSYFAKF
jgi:hypothetical protein